MLGFLKLVLQLKIVVTRYNCSAMTPISLLTAHNSVAHYFIMLSLYDGNNGFAFNLCCIEYFFTVAFLHLIIIIEIRSY